MTELRTTNRKRHPALRSRIAVTVAGVGLTLGLVGAMGLDELTTSVGATLLGGGPDTSATTGSTALVDPLPALPAETVPATAPPPVIVIHHVPWSGGTPGPAATAVPQPPQPQPRPAAQNPVVRQAPRTAAPVARSHGSR